jgi:hypothetical protein
MITADELPDSPNRSGDHVLQENTSQSELVNVPLTGADKVAYAFYATAATAALVGQVWAGVTHIPWPQEGFPVWLRIAVVTPAVAVIELGGVATAALADLRRRKGEQAYAYRAMSLFAALVALVFNVLGHWRPEERFLAFGFGGLSAFAYVLWLIHSSARRRDALRKVGQMAKTGPVYGVVQWIREPKVTWLARSLALEHEYGLYESLRQAREQIRTTARRVAIAGTVAEFIRSEQQDERLAKIAETTYDPDKLAAMLEERVNYETVTARLSRAIAPAPDNHQEERTDLRAAVWVVEDSTRAPEELAPAGGGVPLRGADDRWSETIGELTAAEYAPYDRSSDEPGDVVEGGNDVRDQQVEPLAEVPGQPIATTVAASVATPVAERAANPVTPVAQSAANRVARAAEPVANPVTPVAEPVAPASEAVKPPTKPAAKSATRPAAKSATRAGSKPAVSPAAKPVARPATVANEPEQESLPMRMTAAAAAPEEPVVVAREVAARARPADTSSRPSAATTSRPAAATSSRPTTASSSNPTPKPSRPAKPARPADAPVVRESSTAEPAATDPIAGQERDSDKKKMRAWALLSDWPADRERTAATLASAIASTETYAAQLIRRYDQEHPTNDLTLVGSQQPQR